MTASSTSEHGRPGSRAGVRPMLAGLCLSVAFSTALLFGAQSACALETDEYTPGENYFIDSPDAFRDQDVQHGGAENGRGNTEYYLTCPFYLEWTSPDMTIYEGDDGAIACGATGFDNLDYRWFISTDGGETYADAGLAGPSHTIPNMQANSPVEQPYIYKCVITNGDGLSQLVTAVSITVLKDEVIPDVPEQGARVSAKTGDTLLLLGICVLTMMVLAAVSTAWAKHRKRKDANRKGRDTKRVIEDLRKR